MPTSARLDFVESWRDDVGIVPYKYNKEIDLYMKATGIVRRIDDLGRVVIPKEIRRTMRIREGDPLEIFTAKDGEVVFKKYSPVGELAQFAEEYCDTLRSVSGFNCAVTDKDTVIAYAGSGKREIYDKMLSHDCDEIFQNRRVYHSGKEQDKAVTLVRQGDAKVVLAYPIISNSDVLGMVAMLDTPGKTANETEEKLVSAAALFLGKQMEN